MNIQISLTINESKRLIAKGVVFLPEVKEAFKKKIGHFFFGAYQGDIEALISANNTHPNN